MRSLVRRHRSSYLYLVCTILKLMSLQKKKKKFLLFAGIANARIEDEYAFSRQYIIILTGNDAPYSNKLILILDR